MYILTEKDDKDMYVKLTVVDGDVNVNLFFPVAFTETFF